MKKYSTSKLLVALVIVSFLSLPYAFAGKPEKPSNPLNYRAQFFAPVKYFAGNYIDTYWFNVVVIWLMSMVLYATLYTELLRKLMKYFGNLSFSAKKNK